MAAKASPGKTQKSPTGLDGAGNQDELQEALDTPRTRDACKRLGLTMEELRFRPFASFKLPGDFHQKQAMRFEHFERKRREKEDMVLKERAKVILEGARKGEVPDVGSSNFLDMMESLLDKESKRLETDLKQQLRFHTAMEKENEAQLEKELRTSMLDKRREQQRTEASKKKKLDGEKLGEKCNTRLGHNAAAMAKINEEREMRREQTAKHSVEEDQRLIQFKQDQAKLSFEKSGKWRDKVDGMKKKNDENFQKRVQKGEESLQLIAARTQEVEKNRQQELIKRQVRSEEQQLHIQDVRSAKDRIDRIENWRREQLKEEIDGNVERIETLIALKDQILEQRKARTSKQEATAGARALSIRRDCPVGPGQYEQHRDKYLTELPVPKIKDSNISHEQFVEDLTKVTKNNPPPGNYDARVNSNGDKVGCNPAVVCRFQKTNKTTFLDDAIRAKRPIPAPGRYDAKDLNTVITTKLKRESIEQKGLDDKSPRNFPIWARPPMSPGPAAYSVDIFTRKQNLAERQRSLPILTREMVRGPPMKKEK